MIDEKDIKKYNLSIDKQIEIMASALGITEIEARFIMAIETGEITGDVEVLEQPAK